MLVAVGRVAIYAQPWHAHGFKGRDGAQDSAVMSVEYVVVGREHEVKAGIGQGGYIVVVGAKHRVA